MVKWRGVVGVSMTLRHIEEMKQKLWKTDD